MKITERSSCHIFTLETFPITKVGKKIVEMIKRKKKRPKLPILVWEQKGVVDQVYGRNKGKICSDNESQFIGKEDNPQ